MELLAVHFDLLLKCGQSPADFNTRVDAASAEISGDEDIDWHCTGCECLDANEIAQTRIQVCFLEN
jgi:hypothetical protein